MLTILHSALDIMPLNNIYNHKGFSRHQVFLLCHGILLGLLSGRGLFKLTFDLPSVCPFLLLAYSQNGSLTEFMLFFLDAVRMAGKWNFQIFQENFWSLVYFRLPPLVLYSLTRNTLISHINSLIVKVAINIQTSQLICSTN